MPDMGLRLGFLFHRIPKAKTGELPDRFLLLRDGDIGWAGLDDVYLDEDSAAQIIARFKEQSVQVPIDYEHATISVDKGTTTKAPAAGWIRGLEYIEGEGLYATDVEWTDEAAEEIGEKEYKYISPVIFTSDETGEIIGFHSCALTNKPRTKGQMELLAATDRFAATLTLGGATMPKKKANKGAVTGKAGVMQLIAKTLAAQDEETPEYPAISDDQQAIGDLIEALKGAGMDLADDAPLAEVLAAAIALIEGGTTEEEEAPQEASEKAKAEGKKEKTATEEITSETTEMATQRCKALAFDAVNDRLKVLEADREKGRIDALVNEQIKAGKILPDNADAIKAARALAAKDEKIFTALYGSMVAICPPGETMHEGSTSGAFNRRIKVIKAACKEHDDTGGACAFGAAKRHHINASLMDEGLAVLTDDEAEKYA